MAKHITRRSFSKIVGATWLTASLRKKAFAKEAEAPNVPIDRHALVTRHNVVLTGVDIKSPLSVGNGEFAFTADITGLQTFNREYGDGMPLGTMTQWGFHTAPNPPQVLSRKISPDLFRHRWPPSGLPLL